MTPRVALLAALLCFIANAHSQTESYTKLRDSILKAPKMQAKLLQDSVEVNRDHIMRKNMVRVMVEKDNDSYDSVFFNVWGAVEREVHYYEKELGWSYVYSYNEFGDMVNMTGTFYYNNIRTTSYSHEFIYEVLPGGLKEIVVKTIDRDTNFNNGEFESVDTGYSLYEYDAQYRKIKETEYGVKSWCGNDNREYVNITTYEYDQNGNCIKEVMVTSGSCEDGEKEIVENTYDDRNLLTRRAVTVNGELSSVTESMYNSNKQNIYYRNKDIDDKTEYISESEYLANGLESRDKVIYKDEKSVTEYEYLFYGVEREKKKKSK